MEGHERSGVTINRQQHMQYICTWVCLRSCPPLPFSVSSFRVLYPYCHRVVAS